MTLAHAQEVLAVCANNLSEVVQFAIADVLGAKLVGAGFAEPPLDLQLAQLKHLVVQRVVDPERQRRLVKAADLALRAVDQCLAVRSVGPEAGPIPTTKAALDLEYASKCLGAAMLWAGCMRVLDALKKGEGGERKEPGTPS